MYAFQTLSKFRVAWHVMECQQSHDEPELHQTLEEREQISFWECKSPSCTDNSDHLWAWKAEPAASQACRVADGQQWQRGSSLAFQSARRASTATAAARPAPSACTAVAPATTSLACVTACLDSLEPSATKVQLATKTPVGWFPFHHLGAVKPEIFCVVECWVYKSEVLGCFMLQCETLCTLSCIVCVVNMAIVLTVIYSTLLYPYTSLNPNINSFLLKWRKWNLVLIAEEF